MGHKSESLMGCSSDTNFKPLGFNVYRYKDAINDRGYALSLSQPMSRLKEIFFAVWEGHWSRGEDQ